MADNVEESLFTIQPRETARGQVMLTPEGPERYEVVFRLGERVLSQRPVGTVREGEELIRREIADIQFSTRQERPEPEAPKRERATPLA
jgi:hypothetical protein